jgi:hypothetical protein
MRPGFRFVINWNGQGLRKCITDGRFNEYWRGPNNSDWAIIERGAVYRVDIDNGAEELLWSNSGVSVEDGISLSLDGTHMAAFFEGGGPGVIEVPNKPGLITSDGGCIISIAPDNSYSFLHQLSGHHILRITSFSGACTDINTTQSILDWATRNNGFNACQADFQEYEMNRFSNDPDYITFFMNCTNANPFIMRLSDRAWMSVRDDLGCSFAGNMDVLIYSPGSPQNTAPAITPVSDLNCVVNTAAQLTVLVTGTPLPTLSATGLPQGMAIAGGTTPAQSFVISGTPAQPGTQPSRI